MTVRAPNVKPLAGLPEGGVTRGWRLRENGAIDFENPDGKISDLEPDPDPVGDYNEINYTGIGDNGATANWTPDPNATSQRFLLGPASYDEGTETYTAITGDLLIDDDSLSGSANDFTITGLEPGSHYYARICWFENGSQVGCGPRAFFTTPGEPPEPDPEGAPIIENADIIYDMGPEGSNGADGTFNAFAFENTSGVATFWGVRPQSGRPIQYGGLQSTHVNHVGDGSAIAIVSESGAGIYEQGPVFEGDYSYRFTAYRAAEGTEPDHCDVGGNCSRRRSELWGHPHQANDLDIIPAQSERRFEAVIYLSENYELDTHGAANGPMFWQLKSRNQDGTGNGPCLALYIGTRDGKPGWVLKHRYGGDVQQPHAIPWYFIDWFDEVEDATTAADFVDLEAGKAALAKVIRGAWTHHLLRVIFDYRTAAQGGVGLLEWWIKHDDEDDFVKIISAVPRQITRGGNTYDRGICYRDSGGFSANVGIYAPKAAIWNRSVNTTYYLDRLLIGSGL